MIIDSQTVTMLEAAIAAAESSIRPNSVFYIVAVDLPHVKAIQKKLTELRPGWGTDLAILVLTVTNNLFPYDPVSQTLKGISPEFVFIDHITIEHFA